ncbi:MAG: GNAT family N-acetyltransferase [Acidimicrobiaceae bacterium]|nr:GNAT family N-acetyltransferase [Acidimicrobiaceae bacterium]
MVTIRSVTDVTESLSEAYKLLVPQLSTSSNPPTAENLKEIIESDSAQILIAEDRNGVILGTMTLIIFRIPTGIRAWIEDVVVDSSARGMGIGKELNLAALELAKKAGAKTVELTSRPSREQANQLYKNIGFVKRETNVYRFTFE